MNKGTNKEWMEIAEKVLQHKDCPLFKNTAIYKGYNGQVSALGVSILMIGLKPTIAVYYQDEPKEGEAHRRNLLCVLAQMLKERDAGLDFHDTGAFVRYVMKSSAETLKTDIINCSIALKQVIRTYNLE